MPEKTISSVLRLIGFTFFTWGLWYLLSVAIQSYDQIDAIYLNLFFRTKIAPSLLAMVFGILIYLSSRRLSRLF